MPSKEPEGAGVRTGTFRFFGFPQRTSITESPMTVKLMQDQDLSGKRVLIRQDLNVPLRDGKITSTVRIAASIATIKLALEKGAKVMLMSHLGRPDEGQFSEENSLAPVAAALSRSEERRV